VEEVSLMIFESATTQFLLSILDSTGYLWVNESRRQLLRQSCSLFLSHLLVCFSCRFLSQHGLFAGMNPGFSC
jgi:hypothetical protein